MAPAEVPARQTRETQGGSFTLAGFVVMRMRENIYVPSSDPRGSEAPTSRTATSLHMRSYLCSEPLLVLSHTPRDNTMSATAFRRLGEGSAGAARLLPLAAPSVRQTGASTLRCLHVGAPQCGADKSYKFVVCGAGPGGLAVASSLGRRFGNGSLAVIEPAYVREIQARSEIRYLHV